MKKQPKCRIILIDGVRYYNDKPDTCRKCFVRKNRKVGCVCRRQNGYYLAEAVKAEQEKNLRACVTPKANHAKKAGAAKE